MKTRFSSLVIFRKQKVEEVERAIFNNNHMIEQSRQNMLSLQDEMNGMEIPSEGNFASLVQFQEIKRAYAVQIHQKQAELAQLENYALTLKKYYKEMSIEFEKARHLDDVERQKMIKERIRQEENELNEISIMLHNNNQAKRDEI